MSSYFLPILLLLLLGVLEISNFKMHTPLNSVVFTNIPKVYDNVHSEYFYGRCANRNRDLLAVQHYTYDDLKGKMMITGYLQNITKRPNCVYIRATSTYGQMVRYHAYKFSICISSITYYYAFEYVCYIASEWYLPVEMQEGIEWEIFYYRT